MYQFPEAINYDQFFRFDKRWIKQMNWALLPKASKSILPVIGVHCDEKGHSFPGERTMAILSGLTDKTVREGIRGMTGFPGFEISSRVSERGRRAKAYKVVLPPRGEKKRSFFFYRCVIEGGNWQELKQVSHALYPVMRCFAYFDKEENEEPMGGEFEVLYQSRKWEVCEAEMTVLAQYAGISRPSVYEALNDLEKNSLIECQGINDEGVRTWKVFLIPPAYFKREYLNTKIIEKHKG